MKILILNGPNLNLLGSREPEIYGATTLAEILAAARASHPDVELTDFQSNHEGALIDRIQAAANEGFAGLVINAGAYTHYSYAIRDALAAVPCPKVEVHLSHIFERETFRHTSVLAPVCDGMISGLGPMGYALAVQWLKNQ